MKARGGGRGTGIQAGLIASFAICWQTAGRQSWALRVHGETVAVYLNGFNIK